MAVEIPTSPGYRRPMKRRIKQAEVAAGARPEAPGLYVKPNASPSCRQPTAVGGIRILIPRDLCMQLFWA